MEWAFRPLGGCHPALSSTSSGTLLRHAIMTRHILGGLARSRSLLSGAFAAGCTLRTNGFRCGLPQILLAASTRTAAGLTGKRFPRGRGSAFAFQDAADGARPFRGRLTLGRLRGFPARIRPQLYTGTPGFGQTNRNGLFCAARTVLAFPDMVHFFAYKLTGLRSRRLSLARILAGALDRSLLRHRSVLRFISQTCTSLTETHSSGSKATHNRDAAHKPESVETTSFPAESSARTSDATSRRARPHHANITRGAYMK